MDPKNRDAWLNLGLTLNQTGRLNDAIGAFETAKLVSPNDPPVHYQLAKAYAAARRDKAAAEEYETVLRLDHADPSIEYWSRVNLAAARLEEHRTEEATSLLREAVRLNATTAVDPKNQAEEQLRELANTVR
jgi:tetratricopeptide (TPR) repeat protein